MNEVADAMNGPLKQVVDAGYDRAGYVPERQPVLPAAGAQDETDDDRAGAAAPSEQTPKATFSNDVVDAGRALSLAGRKLKPAGPPDTKEAEYAEGAAVPAATTRDDSATKASTQVTKRSQGSDARLSVRRGLEPAGGGTTLTERVKGVVGGVGGRGPARPAGDSATRPKQGVAGSEAVKAAAHAVARALSK